MAQARVKEHEERWDSRLPEKNLLDTVMEWTEERDRRGSPGFSGLGRHRGIALKKLHWVSKWKSIE